MIKFPIFKIIFGLMIGVIASIYVCQKQDVFRKIVKEQLQQFAYEHLGCRIEVDPLDINIFKPQFTATNITVWPKDINDKSWTWHCKKMSFKFSWLSYIINGLADLYISIDGVGGESLYTDKLAIWDHLYFLIFEQSPAPIRFREIKINNGSLTIKSRKDVSYKLNWSSESKEFNNTIKSTVYLKDCTVNSPIATYCKNFNGSSQFIIPLNNDPLQSTASYDFNFVSPFIDDTNKFFVSGRWHHGKGTCKINSIDGSLDISPVLLEINNKTLKIDANAYINVNTLQKVLMDSQKNFQYNFDGDCYANFIASISLDGYELGGSSHIDNLALNKKIIIENFDTSFKKENKDWFGNLKINNKNEIVNGNWYWHQKNRTGKVEINNKTILNIPLGIGWQVMPSQFNCNASIKYLKGFFANADYNFVCQNNKTNAAHTVNGSLAHSPQETVIQGKVDDDRYKTKLNLDSPTYLTFFEYITSKKNQACIVKAKDNDPKKISCHIDIATASQYIPDPINKLFSGQGRLTIDSNIINKKIISNIKLTDGNIVLPQIYNVVKELGAKVIVDTEKRSLTIKNAILKLHKGTITISKATLNFDEFGALQSYHVPIAIDDCAVNIEKSLIANVTSHIRLQKYNGAAPLIKGIVVLEQSQCNQNVLSSDIQNMFKSWGRSYNNQQDPFDIDLDIMTKSPLKIKTSFLTTSATLRLQLKNNLQDIHTLGYITINGGKIIFPYKPLYIRHGSLYFTPEQLNRPIIDLVAKNKVKSYSINLHVSGSADSPYILLESSPNLTDEQIGALLLVGSENTSLNMIVPALIMQNLNSIIFGSAISEGKTSALVKNVLSPLDHVRFIPSFSDEGGRGGLRGAVEVDVNDRLRALIQKNFSLSEDTKVEIDYAVTDNVSIRGIKDERGDLGGEVEFRWKL